MATQEADTAASWWRPTPVDRGSMWQCLITRHAVCRRERRRRRRTAG